MQATSPPKLKPGARLIREWHGRTHVVSVVDGAFEYGGKTFPSLTAIAVEITGAHLVGAEILRPGAAWGGEGSLGER